MNIARLDKAAVLAALYNASRPLGAGFLQYDATPMTVEDARRYIDGGQLRFDYLKGRVMKINLNEDDLDTWLYNRDNGKDAAERAIAALIATSDPNASIISEAHQEGKLDAAATTKTHLTDESTFDGQTFRLGLADIAGELGPAIDHALEEPKTEAPKVPQGATNDDTAS